MMTLEKFLEVNEVRFPVIPIIPNKTVNKLMRQYKYIDVVNIYYQHDNDEFSWEYIEGINYGWLWLSHKKSIRERRKALIKLARAFYLESENRICIRILNNLDITEIIFKMKDSRFVGEDCIVMIRLSNKEMMP